MNPFVEILDSLIESFSTLLGKPRGVKPSQPEEIERPAEPPEPQAEGGSTPVEPAVEAGSPDPSVEDPWLNQLELEQSETVGDSSTPDFAQGDQDTGDLNLDRPEDTPPAAEEAEPQTPQTERVEEPAAPVEEVSPPVPSQPMPLPEPVERKVMVIHFDPVVPSAKGRRLSDTLAARNPEDLLHAFTSDLQECSAGYARYRVVERVNIDRLPVKCDGFQYSPDHYLQCWQTGNGFHHPDGVDYEKIMDEAGVVDKVNEGIIDEVWMFGPPYCGFYESVMGGKNAFYLNAPSLNLPAKMDRRIVIMGFNYERGEGEMLESYGHRAENIMMRVFQDSRGNSNLWERFTRHDRSNPGRAEVGTIHYAPNSEKDYDWGNQREVMSRCDTWLNFPDLSGTGRMVKGEDWGDGDMRAHHKWWFSRIPHIAGVNEGIEMNWWKYIVDPNELN
jgi:hypothetical protein